jgi:uncharacterized membrane protein
MMSALLVILFVFGIGIGLLVAACKAPQQRRQSAPSKSTKLDMVDHMFLYGEVTDDEFYRM